MIGDGIILKKKVSLRGKLLIKLIYFLMEMPSMKGSTFLDISVKLSQKKSIWKTPKNYELIKHNVNGLKIEQLIGENHNHKKAILQLHGGGYLKQYYDIYRMIACKYAKISRGASVFSIDYRVAPEFTYPCALLDAQKAWNFLLNQGYNEKNIIIVGDSAGGNLALSLVMKLRDQNKSLPKALILMSPWGDFTASGDSYNYNIDKDPIFGSRKTNCQPKVLDMEPIIRSYAGKTRLQNKYLSPVYGDFINFPPMLIQVGTNEILESDAITIFKKAREVNVQVQLSRYYGMFHDFQIFLNLIPESKLAWNEVKEFINIHLT